MNPKIRSFCLVAVTGAFFFSWLIVLRFAFRKWNVMPSEIRMSLVGLAISYPLPWVKMVRDKFVRWPMAAVSYAALVNAVLLIVVLAPPSR